MSRRTDPAADRDVPPNTDRDVPSDAEFDVPPGAEVYACPRCGRPFARERHRDLHLGRAHTRLADDERTAYDDAAAAERAELKRFRIVALGLLVVLYFGFLFMYAIAG